MKPRRIRELSRPVAVTLLLFLTMASSAAALCLAQVMEGRWYNLDPNGLVRSVEIIVPCCDTAPSSCSPTPQLRFTMPCGATGNCTLSMVSLETFWNGPQLSRLDTKVVGTDIVRHFVVLSLDDGRLLVHTSIDFVNNASGEDFTVVEYFEKRRCVTLYGREYCLAGPYTPRARQVP